MRFLLNNFVVAFWLLIFFVPTSAWSLDNDWYIGLGGGQSFLQPDSLNAGEGLLDNADTDTAATFLLGRDVGNVASVQLQAWALGEAEFSTGTTVDFQAFEASVIYRLYDTRDRQLVPSDFGLAFYARVGLGFINRDPSIDIPLETDSDIYFGGGLGTELFLGGGFSLRLEGNILDRDTRVASLMAVYRFGGRDNSLLPSTLPRDDTPVATPETTPLPSDPPVTTVETIDPPVTTVETIDPPVTSVVGDADGDGVADAVDECPASLAGYPVREDGCSLLSGVLSGVQFVEGSDELLPESFTQLDFLADVLKRFPSADIVLLSHTDNSGTPLIQARLTRSRLRTVGTYLVQQGISARRFTLRSLGAESPRFDNTTTEGRKANNRIEIMEPS